LIKDVESVAKERRVREKLEKFLEKETVAPSFLDEGLNCFS
jgi:hypothetical protein